MTDIVLTGWAGETPEGEAPFLLLYPARHGAAARMRAYADLLGLGPVEPGPPPETVDTAARIEAGAVTLAVPGLDLPPMPVGAEFAAAAQCGWGVLTVGSDPYSGVASDLDRYLARGTRLRWGRIIIDRKAG